MKRLLVLCVLVFTFSFVLGSVDVHNYSVDDSYSPFENITGEINLTIVGEEYDALISSNDGDEISLGDFLNRSGNLFSCSPPDCSNDYSFSSGVGDKSFSISSSEKTYVGFVLEGEEVVVKDISFKFSSDFGVSPQRPLSITFFEGEDWKFGEFSSELLTKNWGCYDTTKRVVGPLIGDVLYCEMISIPDTGEIKMGAMISGSDVDVLNMTIFPETGTGGEWTCSYDPNAADPNDRDGCSVSPDIDDGIFSAGDYQVCVSSDETTTYNIYEEEEGDTCGFVYDSGSDNWTKDYAIYAQGVKYGDASLLDSVDFVNEDVIDAANDLIGRRYGGDCSDGCILPLEFSGISQEARIYDLVLGFTSNSELDSESDIYDLEIIPVTLDFDSLVNGVLDLSSLGFSVSKTMKYIVSFGDEELFSQVMDILPAPIISSVSPLSPPAGVPVRFFAKIEYGGNDSLVYKWDFGDNGTETTDVPYVMHSYGELKNYSLILEVSAGGELTSVKTFRINAISPDVAVNESLVSMRDALNSVIAKVAKFPSWYGKALSKLIEIDFFEGELDRLDKERDYAFVDADFVKVAKDLYALDVPASVDAESLSGDYLDTDIDSIDIEPIEVISGAVSGAESKDYANPILSWQLENIDVNFSSDKFSVLTYNNEFSYILKMYSFDVRSNYDRESYFVINRPFSELYFKDSVGARKAGNVTVIILPANSDSSFEFYYEDGESTTFFVSPKLSSIVIEADIDTTCNYNLVCEEQYGENHKNCRSDCKPIVGAIVYIILSLVFVLVFYTVLQIWYKRRYEKYLFKDGRQLYNLLMYVTNARVRGMKDDRISAELRSQGWSSERVNYIIKKSKGQRTGLFEIIPIGKISAFFRNRKAAKAEASRVATSPQQQMGRNINKSGFPRRV